MHTRHSPIQRDPSTLPHSSRLRMINLQLFKPVPLAMTRSSSSSGSVKFKEVPERKDRPWRFRVKNSMVQKSKMVHFFMQNLWIQEGYPPGINHLAYPGLPWVPDSCSWVSDGLSWLVTSNIFQAPFRFNWVCPKIFGGHPNFETLPKYTQMGLLFTNKRTVQYQKWPAIGPKRYPQSSKRLRSNMSSLLPLEFWRYSFPIAVFEGCRASTCSDSGRGHGRPARVQNGPGDHTGWAHSISFFEKCTSDSLV